MGRTKTRRPTPAGDVLRYEFLEPVNLSQSDLARHIGCDVKTINRLINDRTRVTPKLARLLAAALGTTAQFWLNLQSAVDLFETEQDIGELPARLGQFDP